jgi:hypothetical protein
MMLTVITLLGEMQMFKRLWKANAPLTFTGLLMLAGLTMAILGLAFDPRMITGAPAWLKPAKFAVSIAVYVFTLAWVFTLIPEWEKTRRIVGWMTAIVMVLELAIINVQAWRGTTSHFNFATPLDGVLFAVMGTAIVVQTLTSVAIAAALWRQAFADGALGWAVRLGMSITIIGAFTGGMMTTPTATQLAGAQAGQGMPVVGAHTVGAPDGEPGLPGTGWSTGHGDLRVPHFVGLHALQVLPLVAVALGRRRFSARARIRLALTAAGSYLALFGILLAQALRGQSVLATDATTIAIYGAWALVTVIGASISYARVEPIRIGQAI